MMSNIKQYLPLIILGILAVAFVTSVDSSLVLRLQTPLQNTSKISAPNIALVLYEGEMPNGNLGFGYSANNLTSPGPTLRLKIGDVVNMTVFNVGNSPHAFALMSAPFTGAIMLYDAEIGSAGSPLQPGQSGSVIFGPMSTGNLFYTSPVSGNAEAGLWGSIIVTGQDSGNDMGM